jgi:TP901 family phage tail tape measure protein
MADNELIIRINGEAKDFLQEVDRVKKKTADLEKVLSTTAKTSAIAFAGFATSIALVTKSFADYEKALVGVGKTTNIEGKRLEKFGKEFQKLSSQIPISTNELLGIAQAAGQLGVTGEKNLLKFTETIAKLGVSTDLAGEEAATALTRILNVTNESIDTIDTFGSVIVALGNNFAATESEIVRVTTEVSRSTSVFGVSAAQAAALGTALKSVGVQAQLGGSAVGRAFREIDKAIRDGGASLDNLSQITGIAGDQLKQTFEEDAAGVFQAFIEGLGEIQAQGGSTAEALASFGLQGDEINKVLPVLAKNSQLVGRAFNTAAGEVKNATALNEEAAKAFATLQAEGERTRNNLINIATNIGEALAPAIKDLLVSVNGLLKDFSELDKETISLIASFLKYGAIITGALTTVASLGLGFLKLRSLIAGVSVALKAGKIAVAGFTGAATFGLSTVLTFLPEIIDGVKALFSYFKKGESPKSLDETTEKLNSLNKALENNKRIAEETGKDPSQSVAVQQIQARIDKLKELQQEQIKASKDFGTGEVLLAPKTQGFDPNAVDFGIPSQEVPIAPAAQQGGGGANEQLKKDQAEREQILDEATQKRIEKLKLERDAYKEIEKGKADGLLETDLEYLKRKADIENEFAEATRIKNEEERNLTLENLRAKHADELASIQEKENMIDEQAATRREERAALDAELRELDKEQRALFAEEDLELLQQEYDSQAEAEKKFQQEKLKRKIKEQNQFKQDELKYGTEIAKIKQFFASEEVQGAKTAAGQLIQLTNSKNSTLKSIGKAAARTNAAIATAEGAIKAYTSLSGIPIVGPALGAAAAAALIAYGVEQQQQISSAASGGFVPPTIGGARDRNLTVTEPGELIVPKAIAPNFIQDVGLPDTQRSLPGDASEDAGAPVISIELQDRAGEFISLEQREGRSLGLIGEQ